MEEKLYLCSHCKKYKPAREFTKSTKNKHRDMLNNSCKECYKTVYNDNRKKIKEATALEKVLKQKEAAKTPANPKTNKTPVPNN